MAKKKARRGRPPGSKNKTKRAKRAPARKAAATRKKRGPGRPPGTKNKARRGRPPGVKNKSARRGRPPKAAAARGARRGRPPKAAGGEVAAFAVSEKEIQGVGMLVAEGMGKVIGTVSHMAVSFRRMALAAEAQAGIDLATARATLAADGAPGEGAPVAAPAAIQPARRGRPPKAAATLKPVEPAQPAAQPAEEPTSPEPAASSPVE